MKLCFPENVLTQHLVVLGKTGAGKSSALRHVVEHLLARGKRVCVVDPKGDWWGLKFSADGREPSGFPVVAFGNFKDERAADIPMNDHAGKSVAELVATGNRPCIIGFRGWMPGAMTRFWIDFASTLFNTNAGELYLVIDEVHNFAAKGKIMDPEAGKCLHWTNRLMSEGRGVGIVSLIASQRPQKVHNDTLTCCETLVAMRVIHKSDRQAVKDWIDGCGDGSSGSDVLNNLAQLERGEAYVWSPGVDFGPKQIRFPLFETFDSFAPPQLQKKVSERDWSATDLESVKTKFAGVIKEAEANDPRLLRAEIGRLKAELAKKPAAPVGDVSDKKNAAVMERRVSMLTKLLGEAMKIITTINAVNFKDTALTPEQLTQALTVAASQIGKMADEKLKDHERRLVALQRDASRLISKIESVLGEKIEISVDISHNEPFTAAPVKPVSRPHNTPNGSDALGKCPRALLTVLVQFHPKTCSKNRLALVSGYSLTSSGFSNALSELRVGGMLEGSNELSATDLGIAVIGNDYEPFPEGDAAVQHWINKLGLCPSSLLKCIHEHGKISRAELAEKTDYSITSSGFSNGLSELRVLGLIQTDSENAWLAPEFSS